MSTDGTLLGRFSDGTPRRDSVRAVWCLADRADSEACAERWRLAYHHDADGGGIGGEKERLLDAVRRGLPIRLSWGTQSARDETIAVEHSAEPVFVTVTGGELYAQLPEHIAQEEYADPDDHLREVAWNTHWVIDEDAMYIFRRHELIKPRYCLLHVECLPEPT